MTAKGDRRFNVDKAAELYLSGLSVQKVADTLGVGRKGVYQAMCERNLIRVKKKALDAEAIAARYSAGETELALAKEFGVSRSVIRRHVVAVGAQPRGISEASQLRMDRMTPEERSALTAAAHDAVRGKKLSDDQLINAALGRERAGYGKNVSEAEYWMFDLLTGRGLPCVQQKAVGPYNVDVATGSVAVEVLGGAWHRTKSHGKRVNYLLDEGWDVIYVWDDTPYPLGMGAVEDIVAQVQIREADPAAPRRYRVIRGTGELIAVFQADRDEIPNIVPISRSTYPESVPFGLCHCGCGAKTAIADRTDQGRGRVKGQPVKYISGHNNPNITR